MPYKVEKHNNQYAVVNSDTGETVPGGSHPTRAKAVAHMRALYANVEDADKGNDHYQSVYSDVLAQTGNEMAAQLAARGAITKAQLVGYKAAGNDGAVIGGWALIFTDPEHPDLKETYFPADSSPTLLLGYYQNAPLFLEHGQEPGVGSSPIGVRTAAKLYPHGLWLEHRLHPDTPDYDQRVQDLQDGKYTYSSDSIEHIVLSGLDDRDGALYKWPIAACSIVKEPAEPALGPVMLGSQAEAMKSVTKAREAQGDQKTPPTQSLVKEGGPMDPVLQKLGSFLGFGPDADPEEIASGLEDYITEMLGNGECDPQMLDAMGLPPNTPPQHAAGHLRQLVDAHKDTQPPNTPPIPATTSAPPPATMGVEDPGVPAVNPMETQAQTQDYPRTPSLNKEPFDFPSLKEARRLAGKALKGGVPYAVNPNSDGRRDYSTRAPGQINRQTYLPLSYAFHDMVMAQRGQTRGFKSIGYKAMSYSTGPTGGYILEQEISDEILDPLRADAVVFKLGARQEDLDGIQVKQIPAMQTAPSAYWPGEAQTVATSQPVYRMITLVPKPLAVLIQRPFNFFKNMTPRGEAQLKEQSIKSLLLEIDRVALMGEGGAGGGNNTGSRPLGLLNISGITSTQLGASDPVVNNNGRSPTIKDLVNADGVLDDANIPQGGKRGWAMHSRSKRAFTGLTDSLGRPLLRESWGAADPERELLGYPYAVENQIPTNVTTGTNTDTSYIFFGDWQYLVVGMTTRVEMVLDQTYASQLLQGLLFYIYVDVVVEYTAAFNILTGVRGA